MADSVGTSYERWSNHPLLFAWCFRNRLHTFPSGPKWYFVAQQLIISLVTGNSKLCLETRETRLKLKLGYSNPGIQTQNSILHTWEQLECLSCMEVYFF